MPPDSTAADRLLEGDRSVAAELATGLLKPQRDNLVERPWGGDAVVRVQGPDGRAVRTGRPFGESFEISADDGDDEARLHPSVLALADGSTITLPALLAVHAEPLLGEAFVQRYGRRFPLLPKLLDVAELLSVQAHPPGNTEVYVIVDADPGATIRLGFRRRRRCRRLGREARRRAARSAALARAVRRGRRRTSCKPCSSLGSRAARREPAELEAALRPRLADGGDWADVEARLAALRGTYWAVLDSLNAIPVKAGDVIYNANPRAGRGRERQARSRPRCTRSATPKGAACSRSRFAGPGPTFRAWDNVRFPLRDIDIDGSARSVEPDGDSTRGVHRRAEARAPRRAPVRRLASTSGSSISSRRRCSPSTCRRRRRTACTRSRAASTCCAPAARSLGTLERGESALVPAAVGAYRVVADGEPAALVKVDLPPYVD